MDKKRLRFNSDDDLCLLREVIGQNPLQNPDKWGTVQANIKSVTGKEFVIRTLKDHLMLLLNMWKKKSDGDKFRSGTEEVYTEKDILLQEISDICKEFQLTPSKNTKIQKEKQIAEIGRQARENNALELFSVNDQNILTSNDEISCEILINEHDYSYSVVSPAAGTEVEAEEVIVETFPEASVRKNPVPEKKGCTKKNQGPGPVRSRQNKSVVLRRNAMDYLNKKNEKENEIKLKEMQFEEQRLKLDARKIEIEERRLDMEFEERKKKSEIELEKIKLELKQKNDLQAQIASQQKLIDTLLKRLQKYEERLF